MKQLKLLHYIFPGLCLICLLISCLLPPITVKEYQGGLFHWETNDATQHILAADLPLTIGHYRFIVTYTTKDQTNILELQNQLAFPGDYLYNDCTLNPAADTVTLQLWSFADFKDTSLVLSQNSPEVAIHKIVLERTFGMERMLFFVLLITFLLIKISRILLQYNANEQIPERRKVFFYLCLLLYLSCLPLLTDYLIAPQTLADYRFALAEFRASDLISYPLQLFWYLQFPFQSCLKLMMFFCNLLTVLLAYCSFASLYRNVGAGMIASGIITLSLPRLYSIYTLGSLRTSAALAGLLLSLYGVSRLTYTSKSLIQARLLLFLGLCITFIASPAMYVITLLCVISVVIYYHFRNPAFKISLSLFLLISATACLCLGYLLIIRQFAAKGMIYPEQGEYGFMLMPLSSFSSLLKALKQLLILILQKYRYVSPLLFAFCLCHMYRHSIGTSVKNVQSTCPNNKASGPFGGAAAYALIIIIHILVYLYFAGDLLLTMPASRIYDLI